MYLLGVDTGGTKTTCFVFDESLAVLGIGQSGPGNYHVAGEAGARDNVDAAIQGALEAAGLDETETIHAGFAMGALDTEADRAVIESLLDGLAYIDRRVVENDTVVAHYGSMADNPGVTVVAGTGAMAYGTDGDGNDARSSGWGWIFGDEGSGYYAARLGLQAASKGHDGRGPQTGLTDAAMKHFDLDRFEDVFPTVYNELEHPKRIATFAESVADLALAGDEVARSIVQDAGRELADAATAVAETLDLAPPVAVTCVGSFGTSEAVYGHFESGLEAQLDGLEMLDPVDHPVVGTVVLLTKDLDLEVTRADLLELDAEIERQLSEE